jgi:RHS repeat-associated protein
VGTINDTISGSNTRVCLPYVSNSDLGRVGAADWLVQRPDGRTVGISSVTQRSFDASTRETAHAITSGGNFEGLVIYDGNDTVETFDRQGRLIQRNRLDGSGVLLTYLTPLGQKIPASAPDCPGMSVGLGTAGNPSCVTDIVSGRQLLLTYDGGELAAVTDPAGHSVTYQYNGSTSSGAHLGFNALTAALYPDQVVRTYHYNETSLTTNASLPRALTGITDEAGSRYAYFGYSASGLAVSTSHANGVDAYTVASVGWTVTDGLGRQFGFGSTTFSNQAADGSTASSVLLPQSWTIPLPNGRTARETRAYDADGNLNQFTDYNGNRTRYEYDSRRNEVARIEAYGTANARWTHTAWHTQWHLPVSVAEPKRITWFIYNGQPDPTDGNAITHCAPSEALIDGHPIAVLCKKVQQATTDSTGQSGFEATLVGSQRVWAYTYNAYGQVLTAHGPRTDVNDTTTYTYYEADDTQVPQRYRRGDLHTITNALGHVTTYESYTPNGQPQVITDPNGVVTTLTYDSRYRLTSRTVGNEQTTFEYWPTGLLKKTTLPDGSYLQYVYDAAHRLTEIHDSEGNFIRYTLDVMGNRLKEEVFDSSAALARTSRQIFNVMNLVSEKIGAADTADVTTTYGYDAKGNQTSVVAPLGRDTTQVYDQLNRLTQITDPMNGVTKFGYDALGQLTSVTDPRGLVTTYEYTGLGDLVRQSSPDTGVTENSYDSNSNLLVSTDSRGVVSAYTYDALNRVISASFTLGSNTDQTITYTYDSGTYGKGHLTGAADSRHALTWEHDEQGRVTTAAQTVDGISKSTSYSYSNGLLQSMTTPSGQLITYAYSHGRITNISVNGAPLISVVLYEPFGAVRQWTWSNGSISVRTFDQDGKIVQIDSAGLKTYSYDDAFRIIGITDATNPDLSWAYGYDDLDRLISALKTETTLGYTYDANGNRLAETGSHPSTFTIAANSNRLMGSSGTLSRTYSYDDAGNTTSFTGVTFAYNNRGRMQSSTKDGVTTEYVYNALGQLIKKGTDTLYYYDDAGHLIGIYDGSGALKEEIVWLDDIPIASLRPASGGGIDIYHIHTDHLNTPRIITDDTGAVERWRWDAEPFGGGEVNEDPSGVGPFQFWLRFPGQMEIAETGLYYNYFRDYDPSTGRYIQSDPIGLQGGLNTYAYANNSPLMFVDETGENAAAGGAAIGGALLARVCSRAPAVCKELAKCIINPSTCRQRFCRMQPNRIYHPFCDIPGCAPGDGTATAQFKLASAEACLLLRQFVTAVCHAGKSDARHEREERIAKEKIKSCQGMCLTN